MVYAKYWPSCPREWLGTHYTGRWVGSRAGLDGCGESHPYRESIPDRSSRSDSLYRQNYPGPPLVRWVLEERFSVRKMSYICTAAHTHTHTHTRKYVVISRLYTVDIVVENEGRCRSCVLFGWYCVRISFRL
jgi:hypothetical protein